MEEIKKMNKNRMFYAIGGLISIVVTGILIMTIFSSFGGNGADSETSLFPFWFYGVWIPIIARKRKEKELKEEELKGLVEGSC